VAVMTSILPCDPSESLSLRSSPGRRAAVVLASVVPASAYARQLGCHPDSIHSGPTTALRPDNGSAGQR
jgi:hypothetical protein